MKKLSDVTVPAELIPRRLLEKDIQKLCVDWARKRGYWARKFSSQSQRSVPDYLFAIPGLKFAVEFKAPGKTSTEAQIWEQIFMRTQGWEVFECDNFEFFRRNVRALEETHNARPD